MLRWVVAFAVGFALAAYSFLRIADPEPRMQRAREEAVVLAGREILQGYVAIGRVGDIVDPLAPNRKVGKVYVYPTDAGWQVSGYYRRDRNDQWHPYLLDLDADVQLVSLSVRDSDDALRAQAAEDSRLSAVP
jgi:hypothetical protein